ncbi:hypothetical protein [Lysinibacillus fusiformis]|uniref:hypothetical protein n=1 Tax=Lysinibacillus fusiformis TaxID=28031 RepID=UPI0037129853
MSTLEQLYENGLLLNEDKVLLEELAQGNENILVIGNDEQMNGLLLIAILRERLRGGETWYFKDRDDLSLDFHLIELKSNMVKSYEDAREIVRSMPFIPIIIDEINTQALAQFFLECCVGLRSQVTAAYTGYGDAKALFSSFAQLTRSTVDYRTQDDVENYVRHMVKVFVIYSEKDGQKKITVVDNRRQ